MNSVRIQRNDLELFQEIGSGGFGRIYRARWLINDHIVAVKVLHSTHLNNETRQIFFNELSVLNSVRHPNIVTFYGASQRRLVCIDYSLDCNSLIKRNNTLIIFTTLLSACK